jgi:hypothetical protein
VSARHEVNYHADAAAGRVPIRDFLNKHVGLRGSDFDRLAELRVPLHGGTRTPKPDCSAQGDGVDARRSNHSDGDRSWTQAGDADSAVVVSAAHRWTRRAFLLLDRLRNFIDVRFMAHTYSLGFGHDGGVVLLGGRENLASGAEIAEFDVTGLPPDPVIEAIDAGALVNALQSSVVRLGTQSASAARAAQAMRMAAELGNRFDTRRMIFECDQLLDVVEEERVKLARIARVMDESGVVHITPQGLRRMVQWWGLLAIALLGWIAIAIEWRF